MNYTTSTTVGIDTIIQDIQTDLYNNLVASWGDVLDGYGRVYINKKGTKRIPQILVSENDYKDVYINDEKDAQFFFLTSEQSSTDDEYIYKNQTKVIFTVNLENIVGEGRNDEKVRVKVIDLLRKISYNRFQIEGYDTGLDNVFRGLDTECISNADLQPLHTFSVNINLFYYLTNNCE